MAVTMLIFIDESGDTGIRRSKISSRYFVLTAIFFDTLEAAERANEVVKEVRKELKRSDSLEFKFSTGTNNDAKTLFLKKLSKCDFRYRSVVIDKKVLIQREPNPENGIYMLVADQLFLRAKDRIKNATVFMDLISKSFMRDFNQYLKKRLNTDIEKLVGEIKHRDSKGNNLLQLADMVCGAIYRKYNRNDDTFYKLIKKREEDLWKPY